MCVCRGGRARCPEHVTALPYALDGTQMLFYWDRPDWQTGTEPDGPVRTCWQFRSRYLISWSVMFGCQKRSLIHGWEFENHEHIRVIEAKVWAPGEDKVRREEVPWLDFDESRHLMAAKKRMKWGRRLRRRNEGVRGQCGHPGIQGQ